MCSDHPWDRKKWSLLRGGRCWEGQVENFNKKNTISSKKLVFYQVLDQEKQLRLNFWVKLIKNMEFFNIILKY